MWIIWKTLLVLSIGIFCSNFVISEDINSTESTSSVLPDDGTEMHDYEYEDVNSKLRKSEIFNQILEGTYDKKVRPTGINGTGPVHIAVSMYIRSIESIDDIKMEYTVQMTYRQEWIDPRAKYSHLQKNVNYLQLVKSERVWTPDIFFSNEKTSSLHQLMIPNLFTRIYPDGRVYQSYRITLILSCPMNLKYYPLDRQSCPIRMASYGWTTKDILINWRNESNVQMARSFIMPNFRLDTWSTSNCISVSSAGNFSCIDLHLEFERQFGFYLIQIYVPCIMLVMVSWVSFWLEPTAAEARVSLGVTTILTVVTQTYGINQSVPPASYVKAIDVWTAVCQFMVFSAILQFSYVNYVARFQWKKALKSCSITDENMRSQKEEILKERGESKANRVDNISKLLFPIVFALFNAAYWTAYTNSPSLNQSFE